MQTNYRFFFFWPKFDPRNNYFLDTFESLLTDPEIKKMLLGKKLEIELHSVFGWPRKFNFIKRFFRQFLVFLKRRLLGKKIILIWYSGELKKLPKGYDLTLSFSPTFSRNVYLPLWMLYTTNLKSEVRYDRDFMFTWEKLLSGRQSRDLRNKQIACTFISNPTPERLKFAKSLERLGVLDIFGAAVGKPIEDKFAIAQNYVFQLCLENQDEDNYVTEKLFEAWCCNNIPIYKLNGNLTPLNNNAFVDIDNFDPEILVKKLEALKGDKLKLDNMYRQPILKNPLSTDELKHLFLKFCQKCYAH